MAKFYVTLKEVVHYKVEVEADDEEQAGADAMTAWAHSETPDSDFISTGFGVDVYDVDRIADEEEPGLKTFQVHLQQYVEETATIVVRAADIESAKAIALTKAPEADWGDGDDAYSADCYSVADEHGEVLWSRA